MRWMVLNYGTIVARLGPAQLLLKGSSSFHCDAVQVEPSASYPSHSHTVTLAALPAASRPAPPLCDPIPLPVNLPRSFRHADMAAA